MSSMTGFVPSAALPGATGSGLAAIAAGNQQLSADAAQIADPANGNLVGPLTDLSQSKVLAEAGAAVIRASNQMLGTLLDTFA